MHQIQQHSLSQRGMAVYQLELFGPSRYHWDNGYFSLDIERRVNLNNSIFLNKACSVPQVPEKLVLYDYILIQWQEIVLSKIVPACVL